MRSLLGFFLRAPAGTPRSLVLIRVAVGSIFSTQGVLKLIDPNTVVLRRSAAADG